MSRRGQNLARSMLLLLVAWGLLSVGSAANAGSTSAANWWAFKPVGEQRPPAVADEAWARGEVDRFVLARLESQGIKPPPEAEKRVLIRRATFDLTGLPPTPEEVEAFLADQSSDAFAKLVDRLLASHAYGERWGRHWLDV
ncbi:MAG TPA: DUF1549 domain-containing protein, partial [Tepidisphaeraceae bacterium]|nr:DUF1549 domain-containing protein [Tepidisphaeraceae bacterium]